MPQFVWTSDKDGVVTYFNKNWYDAFGLGVDTDPDKSFWSLMHPNFLDKVRNSWMDAVHQNSTYEVEYQLVNPITNISKWYLARGKRVCNDMTKPNFGLELVQILMISYNYRNKKTILLE
ncbi:MULTISPECIES: PAS domain-containing protein [unclassified Empedobacter]|uniref:PAS domain-containing protein n=1 Tax=unclassified Empedobacter TaxID=2643773 RepID=UPI0025C6DD9D|nr:MULTISPECIES: PAS domain-containing protein [unclassified Empedobacter]